LIQLSLVGLLASRARRRFAGFDQRRARRKHIPEDRVHTFLSDSSPSPKSTKSAHRVKSQRTNVKRNHFRHYHSKWYRLKRPRVVSFQAPIDKRMVNFQLMSQFRRFQICQMTPIQVNPIPAPYCNSTSTNSPNSHCADKNQIPWLLIMPIEYSPYSQQSWNYADQKHYAAARNPKHAIDEGDKNNNTDEEHVKRAQEHILA